MSVLRQVMLTIVCGDETCDQCSWIAYDFMVSSHVCNMFEMLILDGRRCLPCKEAERNARKS